MMRMKHSAGPRFYTDRKVRKRGKSMAKEIGKERDRRGEDGETEASAQQMQSRISTIASTWLHRAHLSGLDGIWIVHLRESLVAKP